MNYDDRVETPETANTALVALGLIFHNYSLQALTTQLRHEPAKDVEEWEEVRSGQDEAHLSDLEMALAAEREADC